MLLRYKRAVLSARFLQEQSNVVTDNTKYSTVLSRGAEVHLRGVDLRHTTVV